MDELQRQELRKIITEAMSGQGGAAPRQGAGMGFDQKLFDKAMSDPAAMEAGAQMAGLMDEGTALAMMKDSNNFSVPNGGRMGWTEALSKGIDKGMGTYNLLNAQRVKANALRSLAPKSETPATQPVATAFPVDLN